MSDDELTLSVIMPVHNEVDQVESSLRALLEQPEPPDEIVVVDDASEDGTPQVVDELTFLFPALVHLRNAANLGPVLSARRGFNRSRGDLVMFAAADDRVASTFLSKSRALWRAHPLAGLSHAQNDIFAPQDWPKTRRGGFSYPYRGGHWSPAELAETEIPMGFTGASAIYRRFAYLTCGGLLPELGSACDWWLSVVVAHTYGCLFVPEILVSCCVHPDTYSAARPPAAKEDQRAVQDELIWGRDYASCSMALQRYRETHG